MSGTTKTAGVGTTGDFNLRTFLGSPGTAREVVTYQRGAAIFVQGEPCTHVLYIQRGDVKLSVASRTGREAVVAMLSDERYRSSLTAQSSRVQPLHALLDHDVADAVRLHCPPQRPVEPQTAAVRHAGGLEAADLTPHDPTADSRRPTRTGHLEVHESSRHEPVQRLELRAGRRQVDQPGIDRGTHPHGDDAVLGH